MGPEQAPCFFENDRHMRRIMLDETTRHIRACAA